MVAWVSGYAGAPTSFALRASPKKCRHWKWRFYVAGELRSASWSVLDGYLLAANLGCGGASATPPRPLPISLSLDNASAPLEEGTAMPFTATVVNDVNASGVKWTVSCSANPCGSVSPGATASGVPSTYTASGPPASDLTVTLKANSVADPTKAARATITVPALSVSLSIGPATVQAAATLLVNGTVSNDPSTGNLNWTLLQNGAACSPGCGTIAPANGTSTTYSAPATPPNNNHDTDANGNVIDGLNQVSVRDPDGALRRC
jgi:hypothetical protein